MPQKLAARLDPGCLQVFQDRLPERPIPSDDALGHALDLLLVRTDCQPEHVGSNLARDPVALDLPRELEEHLIRDVREGCTNPGSCGELGDQNRRLTHDGVDQKLRIHQATTDARVLARPTG